MKYNLKKAKKEILPLIARDSTILRSSCQLAERWFEGFEKELREILKFATMYKVPFDYPRDAKLIKEILGEDVSEKDATGASKKEP